jgi:hypothetical protein
MAEDEKSVIFLCYAKPDRDEVEILYQALADGGFTPWMDEKDIVPGEFWPNSIRRAIRRADFFLACISKNSVNRRGYLQREIREGLEMWKEKLEDDIYLIPVRLEKCDLPENLASFQCLNLYEKDGHARLSSAIAEGLTRRRARAGRSTGSALSEKTGAHGEKPIESMSSVSSEAVRNDTDKGTGARNACELFGGRTAILKRMTQLVRDKLRKMPAAQVVALERGANLPSGLLFGIVARDQVVDLEVFDKLSALLELSLSDVLGSPDFDELARSYWERDLAMNPTVVAAVSGASEEEPEKTAADLRIYVTLRAITELAWERKY